MSKYAFLGIVKIDSPLPEPNISAYVEVNGEVRFLDSEGRDSTLGFWRASGNDIQAIEGLDYVDDESSPDGEVLRGEGIMLTLDDHEALREHLMAAVERIDRDASLAAEAAWREVWVNAAVEAEDRA